jgi:4-hydroxybenzoate polyprenyltransferase
MSQLSSTVSLWLSVSRPLLYPLIPILFLLGYQAGGGVVADLRLLEILFVLALTWPVSMILYGINDIYDYDTDSHNTHRGQLDGATVDQTHVRQVWWGVGTATALLFGIGTLAHGAFGAMFAVLILLASAGYSVPPIRIKNRAGLDVIFSGFMYVGVMYSAGYILIHPSSWPPVEALLLTLATIAFHALGTLRDYTADASTGNRTFAVAYGPRYTALFVVAVAGSGALLWYLHRGIDVPALILFFVIMFPPLLALKRPNEQLMRWSMWVIAGTALCVGIYKLIV